MTSKANETQIGGAHYQTGGAQHWDFVADLKLDYFQGNITKYLFRWKKKNGVEDLKKAKHYLQKYIELKQPSTYTTYTEVNAWLLRFNLDYAQGIITANILCGQLDHALDMLTVYIQTEGEQFEKDRTTQAVHGVSDYTSESNVGVVMPKCGICNDNGCRCCDRYGALLRNA